MEQTTLKKCTKCGEEKLRSQFSQAKKYRDGLSCWCKECFRRLRLEQKDELKLKRAIYYEANKSSINTKRRARWHENRDKNLETKRLYAERNPGLILESGRRHYAAHKEEIRRRAKTWRDQNIELHRQRAKNYRMNNKEKVNERLRHKYATNHIHKARVSIRNRLARLLKRERHGRTSLMIIGLPSWPDFAAHLERQFLKGMTWENRDQWHIDHIIPLSTAKTEEDVIRLNHYTNLRPLWAKDNLEKSDKVLYLI